MERSALRGVSMALALAACAAIAATQAGCTKLLTTAMVLVKGTDTDAEFKLLKGKRVAIVCRPLVQLQFSTSNVANDIARQLGQNMQQKKRKIEIIDPDRVSEWADTHTWDDFSEIGQALNADVIIGIDLEEFKIHQSQTLYQGRAKAHVKVYDIADNGKVLFDKHMPQIVDPPIGGIPTQEMAEDEFRRAFVAVVADRVGRYFYSFDSRADFARDAAAMKKN